MHILSIDATTHNLAIVVMEYNPCWRTDFQTLCKNFQQTYQKATDNKTDICKKFIDDMQTMTKQALSIKYINHIQLTPGQKIDETTVLKKTERLKFVMQEFMLWVEEHNIKIDKVLIEFQMGPNNTTVIMSSQLLYIFASPDSDIIYNFDNVCHKKTEYMPSIVELIGPSLKNKIQFTEALAYRIFVEKYNKKYLANKAHAVASFKYYLETFNNDCLKHYMVNSASSSKTVKSGKAKNPDDIADSVMMTIGWIKFKMVH